MSEGLDLSTPLGPSARSYPRLRSGVTFGLGLFGLILYLLLFRPITGEVAALVADLERTHRQIIATGLGYPEEPGEYLEDANSKLAKMRKFTEDLSERTAFHSEIEALLGSPFRVLEFEQRRFDIRQRLMQLAEEGGSSVPADLFAGLPSYSTTTERQQLHWLHLEFLNHVMEALLSSGRQLQIEQIESLPERSRGDYPVEEGSFLEFQLRLRVRGPAPSIGSFLNGALPGGRGLENATGKKAYSIESLDLQRAADDSGGQVILDARLRGFILSNQTF